MRPTLLLVEDDADIVEILGEFLIESGYDLITARDGVEALDALHAHPKPDAVLLDLMIPDLDGWGVLKAKRQDESVASIPVLVLSALSEKDARKKSLEGSEMFIQKPFAIDDLLHAIEGVTIDVQGTVHSI